ncbi:hypothetical protein BH11GEM1_BH11GEM1_25030 [soil metagenome]
MGFVVPSNCAARASPSNARGCSGERFSTSWYDILASGALYFSRNRSPARSLASMFDESAAIASSNADSACFTADAARVPSSTYARPAATRSSLDHRPVRP